MVSMTAPQSSFGRTSLVNNQAHIYREAGAAPASFCMRDYLHYLSIHSLMFR